MAVRGVILSLVAVMIQTISGQCIGAPYGPGYPGLAGPGLAEAYSGLPGPWSTASGGGFMTTSSSPIPPRGVSIQTDAMGIEGSLAVTGQLPFLGVVALEGPLPVAGQGAVAYGCGTGSVAILNEVGPAGPYPYGPEGLGYGYPNGYGPGCGRF